MRARKSSEKYKDNRLPRLIRLKKIGPQCELVWDFSQIKVDALWINRSFIVNIYTFCRVVVMDVE